LAVCAADPQQSGATTVRIVAADAAKLNVAFVFLPLASAVKLPAAV
jgi:hypothetical protein